MLKPRVILKGLLVIGVLVLAGYLLNGLIDTAWIDAHVRGRGPVGELLFIVAGGLLITFGLSRQVIAFLGGYGFGFVEGSLLGLLAAVLGCVSAFYVARWLGRGWVLRHYSGRVRRIDGFIHDNPFSMTLLIRLLPVGSNLLVNLAAGVSSVRSLPFFLGSALGYVPQTAVFALIGSGISVDPLFRISVAVAAFVLSALLGVYLYRRYRHGRHLDRELEAELGAVEETAGD
ncbi:VTT domain-containing protein [Thiohalobacter sp. IOR34]|uniref:TVP38/TMEM64 family protein n=1 Tax=Thiohalobacter sp. IOR34 TaxID=3057176 RepID=UPI0025B06C39|nr:VTT domain-containing protein [Thiohalobacter sp. IOR34]WJW75889.1 VTT domain-containing protein [Thiohalobacter sp. IOR34]